MEKLLFPCFLVEVYAPLLKKQTYIPITVLPGILPMDMYNILEYGENISQSINPEYSWITSKGRILSQEEAAEFALENDLIGKRVDKLTSSEYQGAWKP